MTGKGRKEERENLAGTRQGWLDNSLFISVCHGGRCSVFYPTGMELLMSEAKCGSEGLGSGETSGEREKPGIRVRMGQSSRRQEDRRENAPFSPSHSRQMGRVLAHELVLPQGEAE